MFTIDKTVVVDKKRNWTPDEKVNGMRFASITRNGSGADLVAMYLESFRYRLKNCEQLSSEIITSNIYDESNTVGSMMKNAISSNLIKNCSIHYCNDILTLKWFMHEYKQCLVELKHTTTTEHPEKFEISSSGLEIDDGMSIGYMMYGYDSEYVILQGVHGIENGFGGFHKMRWDLFNSLFIQGTVFGLKKPLARWRGLKFTAEEAGSTVYMAKNYSSAPDVSLMYSLDEGQTWNDFTVCSSSSSLDGTIITLNDVGDEVCFKANGTNQSMASQTVSPSVFFRAFNGFKMSGKISASGNIMSLLDGSNYNSMNSLEGSANAFAGLFYGCASLTSSPKLPATTLSNGCYLKMFNGCTSLTKAPNLPATTLSDFCYLQMFYNCSSLTTSPELPVVTLTNNCYSQMFYGCTSLMMAPELPATTLADYCYSNMFSGCTSLTTAPELPATTLASSCYASMFYGCTSLTNAPELPATTLTSSCYEYMFYNCASLKTSPSVLPATTLAYGCYYYMFGGCTSLTTPPELPATNLSTDCYARMFQGCTSLTTAPELPAKTLDVNCYYYMFYGCKSLKEIKLEYIGNFSSYFSNWVNGVSSTGNLYYNGSDTTVGTSAIPSGWNVVKF